MPTPRLLEDLATQRDGDRYRDRAVELRLVGESKTREFRSITEAIGWSLSLSLSRYLRASRANRYFRANGSSIRKADLLLTDAVFSFFFLS